MELNNDLLKLAEERFEDYELKELNCLIYEQILDKFIKNISSNVSKELFLKLERFSPESPILKMKEDGLHLKNSVNIYSFKSKSEVERLKELYYNHDSIKEFVINAIEKEMSNFNLNKDSIQKEILQTHIENEDEIIPKVNSEFYTLDKKSKPWFSIEYKINNSVAKVFYNGTICDMVKENILNPIELESRILEKNEIKDISLKVVSFFKAKLKSSVNASIAQNISKVLIRDFNLPITTFKDEKYYDENKFLIEVCEVEDVEILNEENIIYIPPYATMEDIRRISKRLKKQRKPGFFSQ